MPRAQRASRGSTTRRRWPNALASPAAGELGNPTAVWLALLNRPRKTTRDLAALLLPMQLRSEWLHAPTP